MKQTLIRLGAMRTIKISETTKNRLIDNEVINFPLINILSNETFFKQNGNILLVIGTPLPLINEAPASWQDAVTLFSSKDGAFAAFFWDDKARKLVVCTDILGMQPLYWKKTKEEIVFSDKTSAFIGGASFAGWGSFIALGYTLGHDTLTDEVFRVEPASVLVIDAETLGVQRQTYWSFDDKQPEATTTDVFRALEQSVDLALEAFGDKEQTVLMSGGYDSRLIAYLLRSRQVALKATIVSHYDENLDADARFAKEIAKHLRIPYTIKIPDNNFFSSENYLKYLETSDSEVPSLYLFISQLGQFVEADVVWEGLLPDKTLKPSESNFSQIKQKNMKCFDHSVWRSAELVFGLEVAQIMWQEFENRWVDETLKFTDNGEGTALFNLAHRARNRIGINPFKVYQQHASVFTPGMSKAYIQASMSVKHSRKQNQKFYQEIFSTWFPTALNFPIAHGSTISMMKCKKLSSYLFYLTVKANQILTRYPSAFKVLQLSQSKSFARSNFLHSGAILSEANSVVEESFLPSIASNEAMPECAKRLLFYVQVWQYLKYNSLDFYLN